MSEEILRCPLCDRPCVYALSASQHWVYCKVRRCTYAAPACDTKADAIAAHNRIAGAVRDADAMREHNERMAEQMRQVFAYATLPSSSWPDKLTCAEAGDVMRLRMDRDALRVQLDRATRALTAAGFTDEGGQEWKPPVGPSASPLLDTIDALRAENARLREALGAFVDHAREEAREEGFDAYCNCGLAGVPLCRFCVGAAALDGTTTTTPRLRGQAERVAAEREAALRVDPEWLRRMADRENGKILSVGGLVTRIEREEGGAS